MEQGYILDTNIAIYLLQERLPRNAGEFIKPVLKKKANLSIISKIELLNGDENTDICSDFIRDSHILSLEDSIVETCIGIRKKYKTKLPDAIIAATAIVHEMILLIADFNKINELNWINPFEA